MMTSCRIYLGLALVVVACSANAKLNVITTTQDLAAIAKAVGGEYIKVESLTPGTRDPHFAVAKPSMIRRVFRADLLLLIGADMEIGWLPPLLQSARNSRVQPGNTGYLDLSQAVALLGKPAGQVSRAMGDVHAKGNPHFWLDPRNGIRAARAIAARLGELDTEHADAYQNRLAAFEQAIIDGLRKWRSELAWIESQPVIAYHTSFIYLADVFGFNIVDEVEPKPGIAPSAASLAALVARIEQEQIGVLIMEPYYERRSSRYLSEHTDIQAIVVPQSVGSQPGIETYIDLFDAIVAALSETKGC